MKASTSIYVVVNYFYFSFVSTLLAYITTPKNKRKTKITWDKKLTTTSRENYFAPRIPSESLWFSALLLDNETNKQKETKRVLLKISNFTWKSFFRPFGPRFGLKIRGGTCPPGPFPWSATAFRIAKILICNYELVISGAFPFPWKCF